MKLARERHVQVFDGLQVVSAGALRGAGDTRAPMLVNILGFWLIGLPTSLVLAFPLDLGPEGLEILWLPVFDTESWARERSARAITSEVGMFSIW